MIQSAYKQRKETKEWYQNLVQKLAQLYSLLATEEEPTIHQGGLFAQKPKNPRLILFPVKTIVKTVLLMEHESQSD